MMMMMRDRLIAADCGRCWRGRQTRDEIFDSPSRCRAPGAAKLRRMQTFDQPTSLASSQSSGSASGRRQASSRRDVQEAAASASGHQATPASGESSGRSAAVQDREQSKDEEDYGECRCMSTWTKARIAGGACRAVQEYLKTISYRVSDAQRQRRQVARATRPEVRPQYSGGNRAQCQGVSPAWRAPARHRRPHDHP